MLPAALVTASVDGMVRRQSETSTRICTAVSSLCMAARLRRLFASNILVSGLQGLGAEVRSCRPIMKKPMPVKPTTPETPSPAPSQGGYSQSQGAENPNSSPNQNSGATEITGSRNEVPSAASL